MHKIVLSRKLYYDYLLYEGIQLLESQLFQHQIKQMSTWDPNHPCGSRSSVAGHRRCRSQ